MAAVRVVYHHEDEGWWAESDDVAGWTAVADSYQGLRGLVHESLEELCGADVAGEELGAPVSCWTAAASSAQGWHVQGTSELAAFLRLNVVPAVGPAVPTIDQAEVTSEDAALAPNATASR